jgi:hypothetical protein
MARGWWQLKLGRRKDGSLSRRYLHSFCGRLDIKASGPLSQILQKKVSMCVLQVCNFDFTGRQASYFATQLHVKS